MHFDWILELLGLNMEDRAFQDLAGYKNGCTLSFQDPVIFEDQRVLRNLLSTEDKYIPSPNYFQFQAEVEPWIRETVARWMYEVSNIAPCTVRTYESSVWIQHRMEVR